MTCHTIGKTGGRCASPTSAASAAARGARGCRASTTLQLPGAVALPPERLHRARLQPRHAGDQQAADRPHRRRDPRRHRLPRVARRHADGDDADGDPVRGGRRRSAAPARRRRRGRGGGGEAGAQARPPAAALPAAPPRRPAPRARPRRWSSQYQCADCHAEAASRRPSLADARRALASPQLARRASPRTRRRRRSFEQAITLAEARALARCLATQGGGGA